MDKQTYDFSEQETVITQLVEASVADREGFRLISTNISTNYSSIDRKIIQRLSTHGVNSYNLLEQWFAEIQPQLRALDNQRSKSNLQTALTRHLHITKPDAQQLTDTLVTQQQANITNQFIDSFLPAPKKSITVLNELLSEPYTTVAALRERYATYLVYTEAARRADIVIYDPYSHWTVRRQATHRIKKERKHTEILECDRLCRIDEQVTRLFATYDGLLGKIIERDWDLIVILSLKNKYERLVHTLPNSETKSPTKRLAAFEKITRAFREEQVEKLAQLDAPQGTLRSTRLIAESVDELLLQIFDLTNTQKNRLLVLTKEARELIDEKEAISNNRAHRRKLFEQTTVDPMNVPGYLSVALSK